MQAGESGVQQAIVGAGLGSLIGVLAGATFVASGGIGIFVFGGLSGLLTGAIAGSFLGGMEGLCVHGQRVKHYERLVGAGHPIIVAHGDPLQIVAAHQLLQQTAPKELQIYSTSAYESALDA